MKDYKVKVRGIAPLMHCKCHPEDLQQRRKKQIYPPKEGAYRGLYLDENGKPIQPSIHFEGCLINAATSFKWRGNKTYKDFFISSVLVSPEEIPFVVPEDPMNYKIDSRIGRIPPRTGGRVMINRPRWDNWEFEFTIRVLQEDQIDDNTMLEIIKYAGLYKGIGSGRPKFGRFEVLEFTPIE